MPEKEFTKIKYDGSKVRIEYQLPKKDAEPDEFTMFSCDRPAPEFDMALQALVQDVIAICELSPSDAIKLKVRGVSLSHTNDILGVCVTALKSLKTSNAPLVLNTPHLPESSYSGDDDGSPVMPDGMFFRIHTLALEAERYLNGDRAQPSLFQEAPASASSVDAVDPIGEAVTA